MLNRTLPCCTQELKGKIEELNLVISRTSSNFYLTFRASWMLPFHQFIPNI